MARFNFIFVLFLFANFLFGQNSDTLYASISGKALTEDNEAIENAEVFIKINDSIFFKDISDKDGNYSFLIKRYKGSVQVYVTATKNTRSKTKANRTFLTSRTTHTLNLQNKKEYILDFKLKSAPFCQRMPDILFQKNSTEFSKTKRPFPDDLSPSEVLDYYQTILNQNPDMRVELVGHSSINEKKEFATLRANAMVDMLIKRGVPSSRISAKGLGHSNPLINSSIIKKAQTKSEKESLHELNRYVFLRVVAFGNTDAKTDNAE